MTHPKTAPVRQARGLFASPDVTKYLGYNPGKATGTIVTFNMGDESIAFDLKPMSARDAAAAFDLIKDFGAFQQALSSNELSGKEVGEFIAQNGPRILDLAREALRDAAEVRGDGELETFERWFASMPAREMLTAVLPALFKANGFEAFSNKVSDLDPT